MASRSLHHFIVYIPDEKCHGVATSMGAHACLVTYQAGGIEYEVLMLNEELIFLEDIAIGIEEEEL